MEVAVILSGFQSIKYTFSIILLQIDLHILLTLADNIYAIRLRANTVTLMGDHTTNQPTLNELCYLEGNVSY